MVGAILGPAVHQVEPAVRFLRPWLLQKREAYLSAWQQPERPATVTVRLRGASSCLGRSRPSRTCSVWRRTQAPAQGRGLALARVRHRRWLPPHLHWRHRTRPPTDPPPDAFSTWDRGRNKTYITQHTWTMYSICLHTPYVNLLIQT